MKSIVHVIKHASFNTGHIKRERERERELFGKTDNWQQIYNQTNSTLYSPYKARLKSNTLKRKHINDEVLFINLSKFTPLQVHR